jgi:hypothetical protein
MTDRALDLVQGPRPQWSLAERLCLVNFRTGLAAPVGLEGVLGEDLRLAAAVGDRHHVAAVARIEAPFEAEDKLAVVGKGAADEALLAGLADRLLAALTRLTLTA